MRNKWIEEIENLKKNANKVRNDFKQIKPDSYKKELLSKLNNIKDQISTLKELTKKNDKLHNDSKMLKEKLLNLKDNFHNAVKNKEKSLIEVSDLKKHANYLKDLNSKLKSKTILKKRNITTEYKSKNGYENVKNSNEHEEYKSDGTSFFDNIYEDQESIIPIQNQVHLAYNNPTESRIKIIPDNLFN